jgi:ATP-binding cassette subfamily C protein CydC
VLDRPAHVTPGTATPGAPVVPRVEFQEVVFGYGDADVLHRVSFTIEPGRTVALAGHSGAGKSTCAALLMRFWDPWSGRVTIGGFDLRELTLEAARDLVGYVPQDTYLFRASVLDNLRIARPDATDAEVVRAARLALADEFVRALPQGYDTILSERGLSLSGGQRQRLAIARAFLKDAPVLVMDEAVANLDAENEREVHAAMARLRQDRATLLIAHRLSTLAVADRVVVIEHGRVVETGSHSDLAAAGGAYARLISSQFDGALP